SDLNHIEIIESELQSVCIDVFRKLNENDILFIDSSHVLKACSDVESLVFEILPALTAGVVIHFHDVRFPFRYEESLLRGGVLWNEAYFLKAFLMYNETFEILFWLNCLLNTSVESKNRFLFLPLDGWSRRFNQSGSDMSDAGGSIYLRKVR